MGAQVISHKYALALAESAESIETLRLFIEQLEDIEHILKTDPELVGLLNNPKLPFDSKMQVVEVLRELLELAPEIQRTLAIIIKNRRIAGFSDMVHLFRDIADERLGQVRVEICSAVAINDAQQEQLRVRLAEKTGKQILITSVVNPSIIGGLVVQIGHNIVDLSLRSHINNLVSELKKGEIPA